MCVKERVVVVVVVCVCVCVCVRERECVSAFAVSAAISTTESSQLF